MADEFRSIDITEVDPATRTVRGRDEHGQLIALTNHFLQPVVTVPQVGEKWLINRQGNQWLLDRRFDQDDKLVDLQAGDVHIDAKNNLIITTAQEVIINGEELTNEVKISVDDKPIISASNIKFVSNQDIKFSVIKDNDTIDIRADLKSKIGYGTNLPFPPTDGQEFILVDSVTSPTYQWRLRYNAQTTNLYKWEFMGGSPLHISYDGVGTLYNNAAFSSTGDLFYWYSNVTSYFPLYNGLWRVFGKLTSFTSIEQTLSLQAFRYRSPNRINMTSGDSNDTRSTAWATLVTGGEIDVEVGDSIGISWSAPSLSNASIYATFIEVTPVRLA